MKTNKRFSFGRSVGKKELPTQPVRSTIKSCSTAQALYQGLGLLLPLLESSGNKKGTHMESLDVLISEEAQQDMDLKSAFVPAVPRQPFFRILACAHE